MLFPGKQRWHDLIKKWLRNHHSCILPLWHFAPWITFIEKQHINPSLGTLRCVDRIVIYQHSRTYAPAKCCSSGKKNWPNFDIRLGQNLWLLSTCICHFFFWMGLKETNGFQNRHLEIVLHSVDQSSPMLHLAQRVVCSSLSLNHRWIPTDSMHHKHLQKLCKWCRRMLHQDVTCIYLMTCRRFYPIAPTWYHWYAFSEMLRLEEFMHNVVWVVLWAFPDLRRSIWCDIHTDTKQIKHVPSPWQTHTPSSLSHHISYCNAPCRRHLKHTGICPGLHRYLLQRGAFLKAPSDLRISGWYLWIEFPLNDDLISHAESERQSLLPTSSKKGGWEEP